ncbi:methyl-accepting chemotaxis protein [Oleidesulfovibrio alaskensis]|jgi:methyl-accepting chemotaxis protein|uniref:methyl-accepting chemotaxis protein n=1 Tax=Oleidesulfovibrio alaskensis TaxID=58180 RepID=UPI001A518CE2|nr:methyl-accepting chemotaxis protein [Oleidesulfovibrio alaskensis]MBL3581043.1 methyl-accepting chemotaxis protein [Oleidesulfovibrio alaskensis]
MSGTGKLVQESLQLLGDVRKKLNMLISSREHEFLALGENIMSLSDAVGGVRQRSAELVELVSGEAIYSVINQLADDMGRLHELCSVGSESNLDELVRVRSNLHELIRLIQSYARVVRTLQMLGISTRIESARLGTDGRGFNTLADDVEKLAGKIVEYSGQIVQYAKSLDALADEASVRSQIMLGDQQTCALEAASGMTDRVHLLQDAAQAAKERSEHVDALMSDIAASMGQIVSSLQFHDIVRQQVEHVDEILESVSRMVIEKQEDSSPDEELVWIMDVARLQAMQLEHSRDSFSDAVGQLSAGLGQIASNVMHVAHTAVSGDSVAGSALDSISQTINDTAERMRGVAAQGGEMGETMSSVASTVADMAGFLEHIEDVGAEIELIALNASIKAAHTGDKGKALGVLASSIQRLSQDAGNQTGVIAATLDTVSSSADSLKSQARSFHDATVINETIGKLEEVTGSLRALGMQAENLASALSREAGDIAESISSVVRGITFEKTVGKELSAAQERLQGLVRRIEAAVPDAKSVRRPAQLDQMMNRYTMKQERDIHLKAFGGQSDEADDDNIELF